MGLIFITISKYDVLTGEFVGISSGEKESLLARMVGDFDHDYLAGVYEANDFYVDVDTPPGTDVLPRPDMGVVVDTLSIATDGTEVATFSNIPVGTKVTVIEASGNTSYLSDTEWAGIFEYETEVSGKAVIRFKNFPYKEVFFVVNESETS